MVIVFKDYRRRVHQISQIPSSALDNVKDWLKFASFFLFFIKYYLMKK